MKDSVNTEIGLILCFGFLSLNTTCESKSFKLIVTVFVMVFQTIISAKDMSIVCDL